MQYFIQKPVNDLLEARQFTAFGSEQLDVANWVEKEGGKLNLYDGDVEHLLEPDERGYKWRWKCASMNYETVSIGDWIIKGADGKFVSIPDVQFQQKYKGIAA